MGQYFGWGVPESVIAAVQPKDIYENARNLLSNWAIEENKALSNLQMWGQHDGASEWGRLLLVMESYSEVFFANLI